jgi:Holliday junction resolvase RusA-like endonuclease
MKSELEFVISGVHPSPWQTPVISRRGGCFYRGKSRREEGWLNYPDWKREVQIQARKAWGNRSLLKGPVKLHVEFVFKAPESQDCGVFAFLPFGWNKTKHQPKKPAVGRRVIPDVTNLLKALEDGLTGVVWIDDVQVVATSSTRIWGAQGGCVVRVWSLDESSYREPGPDVRQASDAVSGVPAGGRSRRRAKRGKHDSRATHIVGHADGHQNGQGVAPAAHGAGKVG